MANGGWRQWVSRTGQAAAQRSDCSERTRTGGDELEEQRAVADAGWQGL